MFPFVKHYINGWPVIDIIHCYLSKHHKYKNLKQWETAALEGTGPRNNDTAAPAPPGAVGEDNYKDVELSD